MGIILGITAICILLFFLPIAILAVICIFILSVSGLACMAHADTDAFLSFLGPLVVLGGTVGILGLGVAGTIWFVVGWITKLYLWPIDIVVWAVKTLGKLIFK